MKYYHYTDLYAFESIIRTQELRASHFTHMNDKNEYGWVLKLTENYIDEIQEREKNLLSLYYANIHKNTLARQSLVFPFLISLSSKKDNLNQWRAYGKDGSGICIELDINESLQSIQTNEIVIKWQERYLENAIVDYFGWRQVEVIYISENKDNLLKYFINDAYEYLKSKHGEISDLPDHNSELAHDLDVIAYYLWVLSLGLKDIAFEEEQEHRILMVAPISMKDLQYQEDFLKNNLHYLPTSAGLKSYVKFKFLEHINISGIIAGPKYLGNLWDLSDLMRKYDFPPVPIEQSAIPYR